MIKADSMCMLWSPPLSCVLSEMPLHCMDVKQPQKNVIKKESTVKQGEKAYVIIHMEKKKGAIL